MKSLAVLGALFFPGTFVAVSCSTSVVNREGVMTGCASQTLFSLESLRGQPFWMYWVITTPLTFIVLGVWIFWTHWRNESVKEQELKLDKKGIA